MSRPCCDICEYMVVENDNFKDAYCSKGNKILNAFESYCPEFKSDYEESIIRNIEKWEMIQFEHFLKEMNLVEDEVMVPCDEENDDGTVPCYALVHLLTQEQIEKIKEWKSIPFGEKELAIKQEEFTANLMKDEDGLSLDYAIPDMIYFLLDSMRHLFKEKEELKKRLEKLEND